MQGIEIIIEIDGIRISELYRVREPMGEWIGGAPPHVRVNGVPFIQGYRPFITEEEYNCLLRNIHVLKQELKRKELKPVMEWRTWPSVAALTTPMFGDKV